MDIFKNPVLGFMVNPPTVWSILSFRAEGRPDQKKKKKSCPAGEEDGGAGDVRHVGLAQAAPKGLALKHVALILRTDKVCQIGENSKAILSHP
jgi:hypothetical protein